jgi:hypothetical protein
MVPIVAQDVDAVLRKLIEQSSARERRILVVSGTHGSCDGISTLDHLLHYPQALTNAEEEFYHEDIQTVATLEDSARESGVIIQVMDAAKTTDDELVRAIQWSSDIVGGYCFSANAGVATLAAENSIMRALLGLNVLAYRKPLSTCDAYRLFGHVGFVLSQGGRGRLFPVHTPPLLLTAGSASGGGSARVEEIEDATESSLPDVL